MHLLPNSIHRADCLTLLASVADRSIDLVLCDLPYGTTQNAWDSCLDLSRLWAEYERILAPTGVVALTSQGPFTARVILSNERLFRYKWVWQKSKPTNFLNARRMPLRAHEDVCIFYRSQPPYHPQFTPGLPYDKGVRKAQQTGSYGEFSAVRVRSDGARYPTDIVYAKTAESEGPVWHPTQKPVGLGRYFVRTYTDPGAVVLDHAFGSGSFLVAALAEGRNFIGIDNGEEAVFFKNQSEFAGQRIDFQEIARRRLHAAWEALPPAERAGLLPSPLLEGFAADPAEVMLRPGRRPRGQPATMGAEELP